MHGVTDPSDRRGLLDAIHYIVPEDPERGRAGPRFLHDPSPEAQRQMGTVSGVGGVLDQRLISTFFASAAAKVQDPGFWEALKKRRTAKKATWQRINVRPQAYKDLAEAFGLQIPKGLTGDPQHREAG